MDPIGRFRDWAKYQRLHHYPALKRFDRDEALRRLQQYEREVPRSYWHGVIQTVMIILFGSLSLLWLLGLIGNPSSRLFLPVLLLVYIAHYMHHRRVRQRVQAKIAAEFSTGRLDTCIECGYDLRANKDKCPECGASVFVEPFSASE